MCAGLYLSPAERNKMIMLERIKKAVETEAMKFETMGTETVMVSIHLTAEEVTAFLAVADALDEHYEWMLEDGTLYINYTEELPEDEETRNINILMEDGCTKAEAEEHLKNGTQVIDDLEENFESYMDEWAVEDIEEYRNMIDNKTPACDWGIVEYRGKAYYIMYCL